jgi:hypothetical protein
MVGKCTEMYRRLVTCLETECDCVTVVQLGTVELYGAATEVGVLTEMNLK